MGLKIDRIRGIVTTTSPRPNPLDYGSYTITATAGSLLSFADSGSPLAVPSGAKSFRGTLETASIRVRLDGAAATATEGELVDIGSVVVLSVDEMQKALAFIGAGGNGVIKGHFYDVEPSVLTGGA